MIMDKNESDKISEWLDVYRRIVLEEGEPPASVYAFCKQLGIEEEEFFARYSSLEAIEAEIWVERITHVRQILSEDDEYENYPPRQKALTFFYTFLEATKGQRSWYLARFPRGYCASEPEILREFKASFLEWARPIAAEELKDSLAERFQAERWVAKVFYGHFRSIINFSLKDRSRGFERTDAYAEKSTRLLFDLADTRIADSAGDLLRFLAGRAS